MTREELLNKPFITTYDLMIYYQMCDKNAAKVLNKIKAVSDTLGVRGKIATCDFIAYENMVIRVIA